MVAPEAACRNLERLAAEGRARRLWIVRGRRLHALAAAAGSNQRHGAAVHGPPRGHEPAGAGVRACWTGRCSAASKPIPMLRRRPLAAGARAQGCAPVFPHVAEARATRTASAEEEGTMRVFTDPSGAGPGSPSAFQRPLPRGGHQRGRRLQPLARPGRHALARRRHARLLGIVLLSARPGQRHSSGRRRGSRRSGPRNGYEAIFTQGRAEFRRRDERIDTHTEISVSPEDDIELRRITITNRSDTPRTIEVTSYAEVVLAPPGPRPGSSRVQQPVRADGTGAQSAGDHLHAPAAVGRGAAAVAGAPDDGPGHDRRRGVVSKPTGCRFIGRGRTLAAPAAMDRGTRAVRQRGPVLDPVVCIRHVIRLQPNETVQVDLVTGVAESREAVTALMEKYHDPRLADRVFELAWTHSHILLRQLNATEADAQVYGRLAGSVIYASALRRAKASVLIRNRRGQSGLWGYGISGDLPIVLVRIRDRDAHRAGAPGRPGSRLLAHARAQRRPGHLERGRLGLPPDAAGRDHGPRRRQPGSGAGGQAGRHLRAPRRADVGRGSDAAADGGARGPCWTTPARCAEQVERRGRADVLIPAFKPRAAPARAQLRLPRSPQRDLAFFNGLGGFSRDGREYVTILGPGQTTPAPWVNVIANSAVRHRRLRERQRLYLVGKQPRVPADPVVQRPGHGHERRGDLYPRRGKRALLVSLASAGPRSQPVRRPPRLRLQHLRARGGRHRHRALPLRRHRRARQVRPAQDHATAPAGRASFRSPATGNGCWASCGTRRSCTWSPSWTRSAARCSRATPTAPSLPTGSSSLTAARRREP